MAGLTVHPGPTGTPYWKNPGDSGPPTRLTWPELPAGLDAGEIARPVPKRSPCRPLANYGYEGHGTAARASDRDAGLRPGPLAQVTIRLKARGWCAARNAFPRTGNSPCSCYTGHDRPARRGLTPPPRPRKPARAGSGARVDGGADCNCNASTSACPPRCGQKLEVFPRTNGVVETAATPTQQWDGATWTARVPGAPAQRQPQPMPLVLAHAGQGLAHGPLPAAGGWPAVAPLAAMSPALEAALKGPTPPTRLSRRPRHTPRRRCATAAGAGALLGGLILNLMPCVFPVLAIKVGVCATRKTGARHRVSGLAYRRGGAVVPGAGRVDAGLRAAGRAVGWGFQPVARRGGWRWPRCSRSSRWTWRHVRVPRHAAVVAGRPAGAPPGGWMPS